MSSCRAFGIITIHKIKAREEHVINIQTKRSAYEVKRNSEEYMIYKPLKVFVIKKADNYSSNKESDLSLSFF